MRTLVTALMFIPSLGWACSCADFQSTLKGILSRPNAERAVAIVQNTKSLSHGVRAKVVQVLYGNLVEAEINIWGDPGMLCRGPLNSGVDKTWIAVVNKITDAYGEEEGVGDFETGSCMNSLLNIEGESVVGQIMAGTTKMKLQDFKAALKSPQDYLAPQIICRVDTLFHNQDDHVDFSKRFEKEVALQNNANANFKLDFFVRSDEGKDYPGHFEGVLVRENPEQLFSPAKVKGEIRVPGLISSQIIEQNTGWPVRFYNAYDASSFASSTMACVSDAKLK